MITHKAYRYFNDVERDVRDDRCGFVYSVLLRFIDKSRLSKQKNMLFIHMYIMLCNVHRYPSRPPGAVAASR